MKDVDFTCFCYLIYHLTHICWSALSLKGPGVLWVLLWSKSLDDLMSFGVAGGHPVTMGVEIRLMRPVSQWWWIINTAVCVYCFYKRSACFCRVSGVWSLHQYLLPIFSQCSLSFRSLPLPCVLVLLLLLPGVIRPAMSQLEVNAHVSPPSLLSLSLAVVFRRWSLSSHVRNHKETLTATFCTDAHFELRVHTDICREDLRDVCTLWMLRTFYCDGVTRPREAEQNILVDKH